MAESNATQVILTDDGLKIIKVQNTANNAASQASKADSAALIAHSAANAAKSAADSAYKYANSEIAVQSTATAKAQSKADDAFSKAQAVGSQASKEIAVQSTATAKAQKAADEAFSKAQAVGDKASAEILVQSTATAKAQSTADSAFSKAITAIDTGKVTSQAVTGLKDGSKLTIAELENGLATKVANSDYASYKTQTASQIGQKVDNGAFSTYQKQTADLISSKVATKDFSAYQATTAKSIESKVESNDFNTYKTQTANLIAEKVANSDFSTYQNQTADLISQKVATKDFSAYQDTTAKAISSKVESKDFNTYKSQTDKAIISKVSNIDFNNLKISNRNLALGTANAFKTTGNNTEDQGQVGYGFSKTIQKGTVVTATFDVSSTTGVGSFIAQFYAPDSGASWQYIATDNLAKGTKHVSKTFTAGSNQLHVFFRLDYATGDVEFSNFIISESSKEVSWTPAPEDQATQSQITQLSGEIEQKVNSGDFSTYKTQTADLIAEKVANKDFSTYQKQTADLISKKVATKDFSAYQATTAKAISSKVESHDFNTYKEQTDKAIISKVSKKDANNVNLIPYSAMPKADSTKWYGLGGGNEFKVVKHAFYHNGADPLYELNTAGSNEVFALSPRFKINANTTYTFQLKGFASSNVSSMDVYVLGRPNGSTSDYTVVQEIIARTVLSASGVDYRTVTFTTGAIDEAYLRIDNNGSTNGAISILGFTELKLEPGDTATPYVYSAEDTMIAQTADEILLRVTKDDLIDQINVQAGNTLISSSGQLTLAADTIYFDTKKPVIIPNANIADTLNGKTFHGGDIISNANNTAKYYPMTITPDGAYKSTYFDSAVGLQSSVESGAISYKYRSMIGSGTYSYDNVAINGQGITLDSGTTTTKDTTFNSPEKETAYISLTTEAGLHLHGSNANIDFGGHLEDDSTSVGMYMNPYGNIIAKSASRYWQISVVGNGNAGGGPVARFGIDSARAYNIEFNRELDIGNFHINTGHTFTSSDGGAIHFAKGRGGANDIYAGAVHYNSLTKSSLLSVKKDVQKADTAYWAQLVNSIDLATYQYKTDDNTSHIRLSSIVDDVNDTKQWQLPDVFISRDENGKLSGVDDSVLLNATLATVQEQQKEIDQLNGHNMELEARLNKLEVKLNG